MEIILLIIVIVSASFLLVVLRGAPFVPSRRKYLRQAFKEFFQPAENDILADIGSGNGVVLEEALKFGFKKAIGYELNVFLVIYSKIRLFKFKKDRSDVYIRDFLLTKLPKDITVFYCFGVSRFIPKAYAKVQEYANIEQRDIYFLSLAFENGTVKPTRSNSLYHLYRISPCKKD